MAQVALITGANKGIGYHIAQGIINGLPNGSKIILGCRDVEKGEAAAKELTVPGKTVSVVHIDLAEPETVYAAADKIKNDYQGLDILVQNAAMAFRADAPEPFSKQACDTIKVNYFGTQSVLLNFLTLMRPGGRIVVMGSNAGTNASNSGIAPERLAVFNSSILSIEELNSMVRDFVEAARHDQVVQRGWKPQAYALSKLATHSLVRVIARELPSGRLTPLSPTGDVRIDAVCPGWCKSDMAGWDRPTKTAAEGAQTPINLALGRIGTEGPCGRGLWHEDIQVDF